VVVADGGQISTFEEVRNDQGEVVGLNLTGRVGLFTGPLLSVGQLVPPDPPPPPLPSSSLNGYVPIYEALPINDRVIGFGRAELVYTETRFGHQLARISKITIIRNGTVVSSIVAAENASAVLTHPLNLLDAAELARLLAAHESFIDPLLAPALVR
jgi:hypothetical protein